MKTIEKVGYGIGDLGAGVLWGMTSYVIVFLTDAVGLDAGLIGTMMLVIRVLDSLSDIIMGRIIDNTHTKIGKAKPWFLGSILPLSLTTVLMFWIPESFSMPGKFIWATVFYFLMTCVFYTINSVAYNVLPALITDNAKDQVDMNVFRYFFSLSIAVVISAVTVPVVNSWGGIGHVPAWTKITLIYAVIATIALLLCGLSAKERISEKLEQSTVNEKKLPFLTALKYTFQNKYFILRLVGSLFGLLRVGVIGVAVYYATYILGNSNLSGLLSIAFLLPMIFGVVLSPILVKKVGMQKSLIIGSIVSTCGALFALAFSNSLAFVLLGTAINAIGLGPGSACGAALGAQIADFGKWKHKVDLTGMTFSSVSFAIKVGTGIGTAMIGWGLAWSGYIAGAAVQTDATIFVIKALFLFVPVLSSAISIFTAMKMDIEYKIDDIRKEIAERE